jgi:hypothetical protein
MTAKFQQTSLQLPPAILYDMGHWPGLTQSEALRLSIERGHYLSSLNSEEIAAVADEYAPILREALADLDYGDYRLVARSLPSIVSGFLCEESHSWSYEGGDEHELLPSQLVERLTAMNAMERIGILDCVVAERHRRAEKTDEDTRLPAARDFEREIRERWMLSQKQGASYVDIKAGDLHRELGGYPSKNGQHRMADCCQVMTRLKQAGDVVRQTPPKGKGASLVIRYFLPRVAKRSPVPH